MYYSSICFHYFSGDQGSHYTFQVEEKIQDEDTAPNPFTSEPSLGRDGEDHSTPPWLHCTL